MKRPYVSAKNETVRMFESDFLEFFSHAYPIIPLALYSPAVVYMIYVSFAQRNMSILAVASCFLLGLFSWTLLEYIIHRWCFHYQPKTRWGRQLHFIVHGVHHDYPNDASRLVMPPSVSLPLMILFYFAFVLIFGRFAAAIWAGLISGYLGYDMIHYATHHFAMKNGLGAWLKQYHLRHHYQDDHAGYGVSSPLWDYVFRTTRKSARD